jgi:Fuc2NAc and GlcNAc transferase
MMILALGLVLVAVVTYFLVRRFTGWATERLIDVPNERSSHSTPTPRGGGIVIVGVVSAGLLSTALMEGSYGGVALVAAAILVAAVSWYDDLHTIGTLPRFAVHAGAIAIAIAALSAPVLLQVPGGAIITLPLVVAILIGVFWGVGLTNVYNFMDGIDGIAGIQAVVAGLGWAVAGFTLNDVFLQVAGGLIAASSIGFLFHNWSPARIFMGDVGSAFLGFLLAALVFLAGDAGNGRVPLAALLFVWPFVFDGMYTIFRRLSRRENIFEAHRSHLYQRLVIAGKSHAWVAAVYGILAMVTTSAGIVWLLGMQFASVAAVAGLLTVPATLLPLAFLSERRTVEAEPA